jgi:hypothetical protein
MFKKLSKLFTFVLFATICLPFAQAEFTQVQHEVKLSLWYDGISDMKDLQHQLLSEHLENESQAVELDQQMTILQQYPEELLLPLIDV